MKELENGMVVSGAACNYGCGWEERVYCDSCGADITDRVQYTNIFGDTVCEQCFELSCGDE